MVCRKMENTNTVPKNRLGKEWPQILAILVGSLGAYTNGMLFVWTAPFTVTITNDTKHYNISEKEASNFTIFPPIGLIISSFFFFKLVDVLGRKRTVLLLVIPHLVFWIAVIFVKEVYWFYAARFICGIGDSILFASLPIYIGEISTPKVRGTWGNSLAFSLYAGQFTINVLGSFFNVQKTSYICLFLPVLFVILLSLMPESPYFYIRKNDDKKAIESLKWLRKTEDVQEEFMNIKNLTQEQIEKASKWMDLIKLSNNRNALIAGVFIRMSQQLCGITIFSTYSQYIFQKAGGNIGARDASMIFSGLCWAFNFSLFASVEKFGRKKSYRFSLLGSGITLFVVAGYLYVDQHNLIDISSFKWVPLAGMITYLFMYSFGLGVVPTIMLGEMYSPSVKAKALCILNIVFGFGIFISTYLFHTLNYLVGLYCPFLVFSICCLLNSIFAIYLMPETKGKTLEQIQEHLEKSIR